MIDCYSKKVVGWSIADHMRTELVETALKNAAATTVIEPRAIFHSDRGSVGEFNRSSLHLTFVVTVDDRQGLRREFATQASFVAVC